MERRIVLCPQGLPRATSARERLSLLIHHLGGDLQRVIDAPSTTTEVFARYLARLPMLSLLRVPPLVVLTQTRPLSTSVVGTRRFLQHSLPILSEASWLLFHDSVEHPALFDEARALGQFDDRLHHAPIWIGPRDEPYLVLSSITETADLPERLAALARLTEECDAGSGVHRVNAAPIPSDPPPRRARG